jgi:hypothetical protein
VYRRTRKNVPQKAILRMQHVVTSKLAGGEERWWVHNPEAPNTAYTKQQDLSIQTGKTKGKKNMEMSDTDETTGGNKHFKMSPDTRAAATERVTWKWRRQWWGVSN